MTKSLAKLHLKEPTPDYDQVVRLFLPCFSKFQESMISKFYPCIPYLNFIIWNSPAHEPI